MRITNVGHAGLYIETAAGSILSDPWFNPAYFASWFPFPANDGIDATAIGAPDYLYISHLHRDHYDAGWLAEHVDKDALVLLPDYPMPHLRHALAQLGFSRFLQTRSAEPVELPGGLLAAVAAQASSGRPV